MLRDKVIDIFVPVDDFCIEFDTYIQSFRIGDGQSRRNRKASLSDSEIIAILILFHFGSFTNFKHYYNHYVKEHLSDCFPTLVSYNRFIELESRVSVPMMFLLPRQEQGHQLGGSMGSNCT